MDDSTTRDEDFLHEIRIIVETLTGGAFHLEIDAREKVAVVKNTLCHIQGIPVSQQQLILKNTVLQDDLTLEDYNITDGQRLQLVLKMRGGPLSAQGYDDDDDYVTYASEPETPFSSNTYDLEDLSQFLPRQSQIEPGQVTLVIFGEDGTFQIVGVLPEEYAAADFYEDDTEEYDLLRDPVITKQAFERARENIEHRAKMSQLKAKMAQRNSRLKKRAADKAAKREQQKQQQQLARSLAGAEAISSTQERRPASRSHKFERTSDATNASSKLPPIQPTLPVAARASFTRATPAKISTQAAGTASDSFLPPIHRTQQERQPEASTFVSSKFNSFVPQPPPLPPPTNQNSFRRRSQRPTSSSSQSLQTESSQEPGIKNKGLKVVERTTESRPTSRTRPSRSRQQTPRTIDNATTTASENPFPLEEDEDWWIVESKRTDTRRLPSARSITSASSRTRRTRLQQSTNFAAKPNDTGRNSASTKTKKIRCNVCRKRLGLTSHYTCRCQKIYCSEHRHAEAHGCSFDYKGMARELLAANNPTVAAPKLPKI